MRDDIQRYGELLDPGQSREALLLYTARPCYYSNCRFCDFWKDNAGGTVFQALKHNTQLIEQLTGKWGFLQLTCSGSFDELPPSTVLKLFRRCKQLGINELWADQAWAYRHCNQQWVEEAKRWDIKLKFNLGLESLDPRLRKMLRKPISDNFTWGEYHQTGYSQVNLLYGYKDCQEPKVFYNEVLEACKNVEYVHVLIYSPVLGLDSEAQYLKQFVKDYAEEIVFGDLKNHATIYMQNESPQSWMTTHNENIHRLCSMEAK